MNSQRETDIMLLEAKEYVRKIFEEWLKDYLGKRAEAPPEGGVVQNAQQPLPDNTGY